MGDPISTILMALVTGYVSRLASELAKDNYFTMKNFILHKYGDVSIDQLEKDPYSKARQAVVAEDLRKVGAEKDDELLTIAQELLDVLESASTDSNRSDTDQSANPEDLIENAERRAGSQAAGQIVDKYLAYIMDARGKYPLNNTDLLSINIMANKSIPDALREEIGSIQGKIKSIVQQVASRIEERKYKSAEEVIEDMPLAYTDRIKARELIAVDKKVHVSFQTLKIAVGFFSDINQMIIDKIENHPSIERETNLVLGNAIMVYELTDFVINYIEDFSVHGIEQIFNLYSETQSRIQELREQQQKLEQQANSDAIEPVIRTQILEDIATRERSIQILEQEWKSYISGIETLQDETSLIRKKLPTLELMRENAKTQLDLIQVVAMLQILKQNISALKTTILTLEKVNLVSLNPSRVRRLLGIT